MTKLVAVYRDGDEVPFAIHAADHCMERDGGLNLLLYGQGNVGDVFTVISDYDRYAVIPVDDKIVGRLLREFHLEMQYFKMKERRDHEDHKPF